MVTPNSNPRYVSEEEALFYVGMRVTCVVCNARLRYGQIDPEPVGKHLLLTECPRCHTPIPLPPYTPIA